MPRSTRDYSWKLEKYKKNLTKMIPPAWILSHFLNPRSFQWSSLWFSTATGPILPPVDKNQVSVYLNAKCLYKIHHSNSDCAIPKTCWLQLAIIRTKLGRWYGNLRSNWLLLSNIVNRDTIPTQNQLQCLLFTPRYTTGHRK